MYRCIYIYIVIVVLIVLRSTLGDKQCIYIYREREKEREREKANQYEHIENYESWVMKGNGQTLIEVNKLGIRAFEHLKSKKVVISLR